MFFPLSLLNVFCACPLNFCFYSFCVWLYLSLAVCSLQPDFSRWSFWWNWHAQNKNKKIIHNTFRPSNIYSRPWHIPEWDFHFSYFLFFFLSALSWFVEVTEHRNCNFAQLWQTCTTGCVSCYTGPWNRSQFWITGKLIFIILAILFIFYIDFVINKNTIKHYSPSFLMVHSLYSLSRVFVSYHFLNSV